MTSPRFLLTLFIFVTLQGRVFAGPADPAGMIWSGNSGGFAIEWRRSDITVRSRGALLISFRALAAREWMQLHRDASGQSLAFEKSDAVISAVGPYLSIQEGTFCDCGGAHPMEVERFRANNLNDSRSNGPAPADLAQIFPQTEIFHALVADKIVQSILQQSDEQSPGSLQELLQTLAFKSFMQGDCSYYFGPEFLSSFAFHHLEAGKVGIRLSVSHEAESCRGSFAQIGILLPIPEALQSDLEAAQARRSGLLMWQAIDLAKRAATVFRFATAQTRSRM
jgi:hypothetical protein